MAHLYKHITTKYMNKKELYEKGVNRKPRAYEIVSLMIGES